MENVQGITYEEMRRKMSEVNANYAGVKYNETDKLGELIHLTPSGNLLHCDGKPIKKSTIFSSIIHIDKAI